MAKTIKAIPMGEAYNTEGRKTYLVMAAHAGRRDRTGAKVHMATLTIWPSGNVTMGPCQCSGNGQLRGTLVEGADFGRVTCKKCGAGEEAAAHRNAKAIDLEVGR